MSAKTAASKLNVLEILSCIILNKPLPRDKVKYELNGHEVLKQVFHAIIAQHYHCNDDKGEEDREDNDIVALLLLEVGEDASLDTLKEHAVHVVQITHTDHQDCEKL